MDEKLQALLQTMVQEPPMDQEEAEKEIVHLIATDAAEIECMTSGQENVIEQNGIECEEEETKEIVENEENEEGQEEEEEDLNKIKVYKPSPDKPLHASLIAGLNRLNGFQCPHCPRVLATKYSLQVHTLVHTGERPHACGVCSSRFTTPGDLRRHMVIHTGEKPYKCDVCEARFTQSGSLKGHSRLHPGEKPHKCEECGESFVAAVLLKAHRRFHSATQRFKCTHCDEMFKSVELVMEHCQNHHMITYDDPSNQIDDGITSVVDVSSILYGRKPAKKKSPCNICGKVLSSVYALQIHKRTHTGEKPYECKICNYKSTCPSVLKRHYLRHSEVKPFQCQLCSKGFTQKSHMKKHMMMHDKKKNRCPKCQEEFTGLNFLLEHYVKNHSNPDRPHLCSKCLDEFDSTEKLDEHIKQVHECAADSMTGEFKCNECGVIFNRKGNLKRHLENSCNGTYDCDKCDEVFVKKSKLAEHQWKAHGYKKKYECSMCAKSFTHIHVLKNHEKKIHGPNGVRCVLCPDETFSSKKELMEHKRQHFSPLTKFNIPGDKDSNVKGKDTVPHRAVFASCVNGEMKRTKVSVFSVRPKNKSKNKTSLCRICGKEFSSEKDMFVHFQSHRKNPGQFEEISSKMDDGEEQQGPDEREEEVIDSDDSSSTSDRVMSTSMVTNKGDEEDNTGFTGEVVDGNFVIRIPNQGQRHQQHNHHLKKNSNQQILEEDEEDDENEEDENGEDENEEDENEDEENEDEEMVLQEIEIDHHEMTTEHAEEDGLKQEELSSEQHDDDAGHQVLLGDNEEKIIGGDGQVLEIDQEQLLHAVCSTDDSFQHVVIEIPPPNQGVDEEADVSMEG